MSTARRRLRFGTLSLVLLGSTLASVVLLNVLATRYSIRLDATSTREHHLSPRTRALLARVGDGYEIVLAAPLKDRRAVDPRSLARLADVLDLFRRSSTIRATLIDTGSRAGAAEYQSLLARLVERERPALDRQREAATRAADAAGSLAQWLPALASRLIAMRGMVPDDAPAAATTRAYLSQRAAEAEASARGLADLSRQTSEALARPTGLLPIPDAIAASDPLRQPLADAEAGLRSIADNLAALARAESQPAAVRDAASVLALDATSRRDRAADARDALTRLPRSDLARVSRALGASSAALVIGPPESGLTALDLAALLPPAGGASADLSRNAEDLLASAVASLADPSRPLVVLLHAQPRGFFDRRPFFSAAMQRLANRGIETLIWEVAQSPDAPDAARAARDRPVVYVAFNTDSFSRGDGPGQSGAERAAKLGHALSQLADAGKPMLVCFFPSTIPLAGQADPTAACLAPFGLRVASGTPILRERLTPEGRRADAFASLRAEADAHPIARAVAGLPTRFEWPVAIERSTPPPARAEAWPIYTLDDPAAWQESQWLSYMQVPLAQHASVPDPPSRDPAREPAGPFAVAFAAQRTLPDGLVQRLVAVGSNTWFADWITQDIGVVDGRAAPVNPGNLEFFEAAIDWLAGRDAMLAPSPSARAVPLIGPVSEARLRALRWATIAGLPVLVLLLGAAWRWFRG
ncbi:MAG: hypothetical protein JNM80_14855 [Phycisphaerae bacterium]|nr:hypothetical protein [Phycisphaerae bacterium]